MSAPEEVLQWVGGSIEQLRQGYLRSVVTPSEVVRAIVACCAEMSDNPIWITPPQLDRLQPYLDALEQSDPSTLPLWGIPFAVKDNIDVAGMPTTAACPEFSYMPKQSAFVVQCLVDAGAIPVGKTNLDQFATGLVGVRSPYGTPTNPRTPDLVPGGSSSGSAIALACGLVSFALGTDTAGSGRIPAGFNGLIGLKPTRGLLSTSGVVPACRSLDCVSIFTRSPSEAAKILRIAGVWDSQDPFARTNTPDNNLSKFGQWSQPLRLGVIAPEQLEFFGDAAYADAYQRTLQAIEGQGVSAVELDFRPFVDAAKQLYEGPWVTERYIAMQDILQKTPDVVWPVTRQIVTSGQTRKATEVYESIYQLAGLRNECLTAMSGCDALLTPTAGKHFSLDELEADPLGHNQSLGHYTNYMNLLDFCGLAIPGKETDSGRPFGVTLVGDNFQDMRLLAIAARLESILHDSHPMQDIPEEERETLAPYKDLSFVNLAVCGAHMGGLPLNHQLTSRGAVFVEATRTSADYRLFALSGGPPKRPGMVRVDAGSSQGASIELEIWRLPAAALGSFVTEIPSPLGIGLVEIQTGEKVLGFLCEQAGLSGATEVTEHGGWRTFLATQTG